MSEGEKNVIVIICNLYDLVCWKILPGDIDRYGYRWTDVHCFPIIDHWWHYSIGDITFIIDQEEKTESIVNQLQRM